MSRAVAIIAAHPDDEVLGCGGAVARFAREGRKVHVLILADGEDSRSARGSAAEIKHRIEVRGQAARAACEVLGCASVKQLGLPDHRLDGVNLLDLVQPVEALIRNVQPSTLLTPHSGDVNIDHRQVHEAVLAACRPQPGHPVEELLFFEVPSSTEWRPPGELAPFSPNWFVDIAATLSTKIEALKAYQAELRDFPHPRSVEGISALARWRGVTVGVDAAEGFILGRKKV